MGLPSMSPSFSTAQPACETAYEPCSAATQGNGLLGGIDEGMKSPVCIYVITVDARPAFLERKGVGAVASVDVFLKNRPHGYLHPHNDALT